MSSTHTHGSLSSTSTHNSISFLRVPKSGFSGKTKEQSKNTKKSGQAEDGEEKDDWYIPYKGPYEPAPATTTTTGSKKREKSRSRDSWGDPVPGMESGAGDEDKVNSYPGGVDERKRSDQHHLHVHAPSTAQDSQGSQQRLRSQSHSSNQNQPNQPLSLRPVYSSQSPKISSYINLDAAGGVGNSPVPLPSSSRHMLHAGYGASRFDGDGGGSSGVGGDGMGRPWSAREARGREGNEGVGAPRTLKQRSSLASLFEKKYSLLKKLSKLGLGASGGKEGKEPTVEGDGATVDPGQSAETREQPPPRIQSQTPLQPQYQPQLAPSPGPRSRNRPTSSHLRIIPPPSSRLTVEDPDEDEDHNRGGGGDIMVVPRSPLSETETKSVSVYSQPSPFVPLTRPKSMQGQEEPKDKEWAQLRRVEREEEKVPVLRLTPPPVVVVDQDNPTTSPPPLTASSMSSFASKQRTLSSADSSLHSDSNSRSNSHSRSRSNSNSNSQSHSQHSASAPAPSSVPLGIVDEDDSHVDSYYDMLITSSVSQSPQPPVNPMESRTTAGVTSGQSNSVDERHPYAYAVTFPSGQVDQSSLSNDSGPVYSHRVADMQKTRLSPIPQSRPSLALRSVASSPDLIGREKGRLGENDDAQRLEGVDMSRLRPHVREKLQSTGGRGKERWLSTDLIAIFLPKPKFKIKAKSEKMKTKKSNGKEKSQSSNDLPSSVAHDNRRHHQGAAPSRTVVGDNMAEFGVVQRLSDVQEEPLRKSSTDRRKSYAYDDLSLLSLDRVLEEGDKLEQDRIKWQAQAVKSIGNKHARIVSRSRSKSLTQAGRKMRSIPVQQQQHRHHHTRGQQSSIDYLAARACLGDQDLIPVVDEDDTVIDIGRTPTPVKRPQFDFPKHNVRERHERMPSGSSGLATSSGGHRSSNGLSARSGSGSTENHKRNDSWSRSAVRIAKSLPQLCGVVNDDDDNTDQNNNKRIQHQSPPQPPPPPPQQQHHTPALSPELTSKASPSDTLLNPITGDNNENRKPSPSPSNTSGGGGGGVLVGIAISTPPESQEPAYRDYHHPYTIGAHRTVDDSKRNNDEDSNERPPSDIRLLDHPYARGSSISRCVAGEREPDYVGPHPAVAVAMTKELMANLGLSELSARHRLPPQVILAHHPPPLIRVDSGSQTSQSQPQPPPPLQAQQPQPQQQRTQQLQKPKSSNQLYVKVDDNRNSYQDLQPYVRADSDVRPSDRLWVTYSPGTVREVMPNEVFQYSPYISNQDVAHVAAASGPASTSGHDPVSASSDGAGTDFFLQRYQRMSTVYQDTATMSQALGNAMYDSSSTQDARRRRRSVDTSEEHQQTTTTTTTTSRDLVTTAPVVLDPAETDTSTSQEQHLLALRYTVTPPPRVLFGPHLNTTPPKHTTDSVSNLSLSRVSSPILPRPSPSTDNHHSGFVVFTDPFPRGGRVSAASPEHSSSGTGTSPPTSPTIPRVGSPDNLEPFHGLFYRPPGGSESDSPVQSPSHQLARIPDQDEEGEEPSHLLLDDTQWIPRLGGSGLTTLMKEVNDELEQMVLERQRDEQRERSESIRSSSTLQSQRPSTSESASTSTTSKGGGSTGGVKRSRRINTEAGPLDFVLDRRMLPQQDPPTTQSGYVPRPNRISTFYPSTPIPEDIEFSRASSPFEGTVEDETVRLPTGSNNPSTNTNQTAPPPTTMSSMSQAPPRSGTYPTEEEYLALYYPDGVLRASYHTTTDTLSRISTLSEFPVPPNGITPEEISILTAHPR